MGKPGTKKPMGDYKETLETFYSEKRREKISVGTKNRSGRVAQVWKKTKP